MPEIQTPLVENTDPTQAALLAGVRMIVIAAGPWLVAQGYAKADSLPGLLTLAISLATAAYGIYRTHARQTKLVAARDSGTPIIKKS